MIRALFPGSFDPPTNGHMNIVRRAAGIFDAVSVVIAVNPNKHYTFSAEERYGMMEDLVSDVPNVDVHLWDRLIVEFAERADAKVMIRGVRALDDFEYEFELSMLNKGLNPRVETILMPTDPQYFVLRSSAIKELARLGGDISTMVPEPVAVAIARKIREGAHT
ncbi:MAG: pantetheine-phosphate adenylyltransferase [Spirochaetaceae bacterium]